jgi:3-deoxy-D-manno-octulosonate 8-phosphate phosphatase (KDO 8-P phosphatase)
MYRNDIDQSVIKKAARIKLLIMDVDGVLTDGSITYDNNGAQIQTFHVHDGFGIKMLRNAGIMTAIISARSSEALKKRASELKIDRVFSGAMSKLDTFLSLTDDLSIKKQETAYIGDDWIDLPVMLQAGLSVAVANARHEVKEMAHYTTRAPGGRGAVREVCEIILAASGKLEAALAMFTG